MNDFRMNYTSVLADVARACEAANRRPTDITVVAVTKTVGPQAMPALMAAGINHFGENRWQQARDKLALTTTTEAVWHFIGRLQTNKVKYIVPRFDWIHSLDSVELAQAVGERAQALNKRPNVLVQVNVSGEETKTGIAPEHLRDFLQSIRALQGIRVCGLMTMAPFSADAETARPVFRTLRELLSSVRKELSWPELQELSMGMSNDFTVAIEEGASLVRIGRRLTQTNHQEDA